MTGRWSAVEATLDEFLFNIVASFCVIPYASPTSVTVRFLGLLELFSLGAEVTVTGQTGKHGPSLLHSCTEVFCLAAAAPKSLLTVRVLCLVPLATMTPEVVHSGRPPLVLVVLNVKELKRLAIDLNWLFHVYFLLPDRVSRQKLPVTGACRGTTSACHLQSRVAIKSLSCFFFLYWFYSWMTYFYTHDEPFLFVRHCKDRKKGSATSCI